MNLSRINLIILLAVLLIFSKGFSQEKEILSGQIITEEPLNSPVHIINITLEKGTLSELTGSFSVEVNPGDILLFSSIQFEKKQIQVTPKILQLGSIEVNLLPVLNELDEVRLHNLSGNLAKDIQDIKTYDPTALGYTFSDKKPLSIEERKFSALNSNPIGMIYGVISGENKMLKKAIANNKLRKLVIKAKEQLPNEVFTETLKLKENKIVDFLYYCSRKPNFKELVNKNDPLILMEFVKGMITEYNEFIQD